MLGCSFHTNIHALDKSGTTPGNDESVNGNDIGDLCNVLQKHADLGCNGRKEV